MKGVNMNENIVLLSFEEESKAYQMLSELKAAALQGRLQLKNAAVIECDEQGQISLRDGFSDGAARSAPLAGTFLGSLVGILGGPLGVLLGATTGALIGSVVSTDKVKGRASLLEQMIEAIPNGATAVILHADELAEEVLDGLARDLDAVVIRRPAAAIRVEVEQIKKAEEAAAKEARRVLRDKKQDEWSEKFDNWKEEIQEGLESLKQKILRKKEG
jgi:uncharacterized membrane protein